MGRDQDEVVLDISPLPVSVVTKAQTLEENEIYFRDMKSEDVLSIKGINEACFPLKYDNKFYEQLREGSRDTECPMKTIVAVKRSPDNSEKVIGAITYEIKSVDRYDDDYLDRYIAYEDWASHTKTACYILTLAVSEEFRRFGVASMLIDNCVQASHMTESCVLVFLHVIHYNAGAISFYEKHQFKRRKHLVNFYRINGAQYDAYVYALDTINANLRKPYPRPTTEQHSKKKVKGKEGGVWKRVFESFSAVFKFFANFK